MGFNHWNTKKSLEILNKEFLVDYKNKHKVMRMQHCTFMIAMVSWIHKKI